MRQDAEEVRSHILFTLTFPENRAAYDNVQKSGTTRQATDDNIAWRMRITLWIITATDTHSEYEKFIAFSHQKWLRERASMLRLYLYSSSCILYHWLQNCINSNINRVS
jgi:hypothetical protein